MNERPKDDPLISIIVPSYNQGKYIEKTILSVIHQSYGNWELIIQDACSSDETAAVCSHYGSKDKRIRFYQEKDKGFADAVNKALEKAQGAIGAIQSSDDYYAHAGVFSEVVGHFKMHPLLNLVTSGSRMVDDQYQFLDIPSTPRKSGEIDPIDAFRLLDHFAQGSTFFRIDRVRDVGGLRPEYDMVADTDLWVRVADYSPVHPGSLLRVDGVWSHLIMHPEQRSADQTKFHLGRCKMYISYLTDGRMAVSDAIKRDSVIGHLTDAYHYLLFKKKPTGTIDEYYRQVLHSPIPFRWRLKGMLTRIPLLHDIYFRNFKDNDSAYLLSQSKSGNAIWFPASTTDVHSKEEINRIIS